MNVPSWFAILLGLGFAWAGVMAIVVVMQRRSPTATIAWLLVLALLPVVGWLIYRLIGARRLERTKLRRRVNRAVIAEAAMALEAIASATPTILRGQLARIATTAGEGPPLHADSFELYFEGDAAYAAVGAAIAAAQHHIHVEVYIWEDDVIGRRLRDQLVARASAGVRVRVLVDGTGASGVRGRFFAPLVAAGGEIAWFNPVVVFRFRRPRADLRNHRKIVVCDGKIGFTGGMNVADAHSAECRGDRAWRDTHARFEGSVVRSLQRVFVEDWLYASNQEIAFEPPYFPVTKSHGGTVVQIVSSGPDSDAYAVHKVLFAAIGQATERLWITTPYLVPDDAILTCLVSAAMRGVDTRILIPARSDSRLVDLAARSYLPELLAAGARVFEYGPRFIHAKTLVIDDDLAIVGTSNLDNRSFRLNFEVIAVIYDRDANAQLARAFEADSETSAEVDRDRPGRQRFMTRLGRAGARLLSPLL